MSFEPVTFWKLRCDGRVTHGQCPTVVRWFDDDAEELLDATLPVADLAGWGATLAAVGWVLMGQTLMCPAHVKSAADSIAAEYDGLPFYQTSEGQP